VRCRWELRGTPPDATGGWTGRLKHGTAWVGVAIPAPGPYVRLTPFVAVSVTSNPFTWVWTKSGQTAVTSAAGTRTCAPQ
jgi:hypothetical protein